MTDEQIKQMVEQEFYSSEARAEYAIDPRMFYNNKLIRLWYMVLKLSQPADIQPLEMRHDSYEHGDIELPATGYDMQDKINEIINRLNNTIV